MDLIVRDRLETFLWRVIASNGDPLEVMGDPEDAHSTILLAVALGHVTVARCQPEAHPVCWVYRITRSGCEMVDIDPDEECNYCGAPGGELCGPTCLAIEKVREKVRAQGAAAQ